MRLQPRQKEGLVTAQLLSSLAALSSLLSPALADPPAASLALLALCCCRLLAALPAAQMPGVALPQSWQ